jgi:hypothetical protein
MVVFNDYLLPFQSYGLAVTDDDINRVSILLFLGYLAFAIGFRLVASREYTDQTIQSAGGLGGGVDISSQRFLGILAACLFAFCIVFFSTQLLAIFSGYEGKIEARYESSAFSLFYNLFLISFVAYGTTNILFRQNYAHFAMAMLLALVGLSLLTFSKEPMVYAALILLSVGSRIAPSKQSFTLLVSIGVAGLLLIFAVPTFSVYRSTGALTFQDPSEVPLAYLFSDASGPFSSIILAVRDQANLNLGPLLESFLLWIPRSIWAGRPLDAAEEYARGVMTNWQPGFGLGFSPFAEAKIRFGLILSPALLFMAGLFMATIQRVAAKRIPVGMVPGLILVIQGYTLFTAHRGAFSGLITAMAQFWVPFLAIFVMVKYAQKPSPHFGGRAGGTR